MITHGWLLRGEADPHGGEAFTGIVDPSAAMPTVRLEVVLRPRDDGGTGT